MTSDATSEVYDLLILVDATYSMSSYLESLKTSLPKIIAISNLTNSFERIGLLAYRDYSEAYRDKHGLLEWSGWYNHDNLHTVGAVSADILRAKAAGLEPSGGGDFPEATKTGLARAYSLMRVDATTIILLYTDAPPQCWMVADKGRGSNYYAEQTALNTPISYDGFGLYFADWVSASKRLHEGPRKAHVFCFLDEELANRPKNSGYYTYISTITRGACLSLTDVEPHSIAQVTVDVLLAWMGSEKVGVEKNTMPAKLIRYKNGDNIKKIKDEKDPVANSYFWAHNPVNIWNSLLKVQEETKVKEQLQTNLTEVTVDSEVLKQYLPKKKTPVSDFAQRYAKDEDYKKMVVEQLKTIIETDVTSMSLNPVFGALWRAVCNDRENPARDELITAFGLHVDRIANAQEKMRTKIWLEESYDYATEILVSLEAVSEDQRFPCVYLDPTIEFRQARKKGEEEQEDIDEDSRPVTAFRRDELLEIGRSCDGRILRRLGKVLTRITFVKSAADLPAHIAATTDAEVPKIPLVLASKEHGWKFWKILLHIVLPGTMLAARPATVLAALAIRIGLKPLFTSACAAMMFWRDKWNNVEVPETWNSSCLGLLLDADAEYRKQKKSHDEEKADDGNALLLNTDRALFTKLVTYQHTGANLLTTLRAEIGWTPEKTQMPVGPVVVCRGCGFPRSITIMTEKSGGRCGLCVIDNWTDTEHKKRSIEAHVTKDDNEASSATWLECSVRTCRAQYVCYNPGELNVRPKCHHCRLQSGMPDHKRNTDPAPTLECKKCLSKTIWPNEWSAMAPTPFNCTACINGRKTIVTVNTNAEQICKENGQLWLLRNDNGVIKEPFKRSLFNTVSTLGLDSIFTNVEVFPALHPEPTLTLRGKQIRNQHALKTELLSWIERRTAERSLCSLCFDIFPKRRLLPACRRRGCYQHICEGCLNGWYGLNNAGSIINTSALFCPFCRRPPAARTLATYGMGIHAVGDLGVAVEERGQWIHAWCYDCGKARRYMERECVRGVPDAVQEWKCEVCSQSALERARVAEDEARQALALATGLDAQGQYEARTEAQQRLRQAQRLRKELECPAKECPGCKTPTQKTYGCDHITCTFKGCKTHWCWSCGKGFDSGSIYAHMSEEHGGMYAGGGELGFESEDEDEDMEDEEWYN